MRKCIRCDIPILEESLSFWQRLIEDTDFCDRCWTYLISEEDLPIEYPARFLSVA
jgi:hypothetical protein